MTGDRIVDVPTAARRDPQRATVRLLPIRLFPGVPLPGEPVMLRMAGTFRPVPGMIHFVHWQDGIVAVEPDFQLIRQANPFPTCNAPTGPPSTPPTRSTHPGTRSLAHPTDPVTDMPGPPPARPTYLTPSIQSTLHHAPSTTD